MIQESRVGIVDTRAPADAGAEMVVPHSLGLTGKTTAVQATTQSIAVSVLDLIATRAGEPTGSAIAKSVELARYAEQLGYRRYWVAEHHSIGRHIDRAFVRGPVQADAGKVHRSVRGSDHYPISFELRSADSGLSRRAEKSKRTG